MRCVHGTLFYISAAYFSQEYVESIKVAPPAEIAVGVILYGVEDPFISGCSDGWFEELSRVIFQANWVCYIGHGVETGEEIHVVREEFKLLRFNHEVS